MRRKGREIFIVDEQNGRGLDGSSSFSCRTQWRLGLIILCPIEVD